jgi:hypothetical protein
MFETNITVTAYAYHFVLCIITRQFRLWWRQYVLGSVQADGQFRLRKPLIT